MKFHGAVSSESKVTVCLLIFILMLLCAAPVAAGDNQCNQPGDEPDVIVGNLHQISRYGPVGDVTAYAIGTVSCNIGTCWLNWFQGPSNQHPVIAQNMFRLKDGRFEQIGQSWLKHGFFALSQNFCFNDCQPTSGTHLGVHCSDPYSSGLNGDQDNLGPKFEVNATTGVHPHPVTDLGQTGNAIFKRVQVHNDNLDAAMNPGALYFIEGQYIAEDDALAGNQNNNSSYRKVFVSQPSFNLSFDGPTQQQDPAIQAWQDYDTGVELVEVDVPSDGRFIIGTKVTDLGGGMWHYEYAIQNLTSHRSAAAFKMDYPTGATLNNVGFRDIDYHSGEPFTNTDWNNNGGSGGTLRWNTTPHSTNPDANALRWGTLYNFRFDSAAPPVTGDVTIEMFRPGVPIDVTAQTLVPAICVADGACNLAETPCNCAIDCGEPTVTELTCNDTTDNDCDFDVDCDDSDCCADGFCSPDADNDTYHGCADCNDFAGDSWSSPGATSNLILAKSGADTVYTWDVPADLGGDSVTYELLRSGTPDDWASSTCLVSGDPTSTTMADSTDPAPGGMYSYIPRALNNCPGDQGTGDMGSSSAGNPRKGRCI